MAASSERLFETLEPPPGGVPALRDRLRRDTRRRARWRRLQGVTALALAALAVSVVFGLPRTPPTPELDPARVQLGLLEAVPIDVLTIPEERARDLAVRRVPLPTDDVVFYLVGSIQD